MEARNEENLGLCRVSQGKTIPQKIDERTQRGRGKKGAKGAMEEECQAARRIYQRTRYRIGSRGGWIMKKKKIVLSARGATKGSKHSKAIEKIGLYN